MPLDPSIPLGVRPIAPQAQVSPFEMISQWAQIQNAINQNRLFQQTFLARQKAGQILASAPSLEAGLQGLLADPDVAPFAGETINNIRQSQFTMSQLQNVQQGQVQSGLDAFIKMLPAVLASPDEATWNGTSDSVLARLPEGLRPRAAVAINSLKKAILDDLPSDPEQAKQVATQRLSGLAIAGGLSSEGFKQLYGGTETIDLGDRIQPVKKIPEQLGGGFRSFDQTFPKGLAPQITTQGGVPVQVGGAPRMNPLIRDPMNELTPVPGQPGVMQGPDTGDRIEQDFPGRYRGSDEGIYMNAPLENELVRPHWMEHPELAGPEGRAIIERDNAARARRIQRNPLAPPPGAQDSPLNAPNGARSRAVPPAYASDLGMPGSVRPGSSAPQAQDVLAGDGKPLYEGLAETPRVGRSNLTGTNLLSPAQQKSAEKLMERFQGEELDAYRNNVASLGALDRMDHALETMAKSGGLLTPGAFGNTRVEMARTLNLLGGLVGYWDPTKPQSETNKAPVDPAAIATAEDLRKEATRAGMLFLSQTLGAQREAASVIFSTIQAVPGLDNTLLGGRLVSRSLRAAAERDIDLRKFQERWAAENQGDLSGSTEAFNKSHPGEAYFEKVLASMGMSEKGFESPEAIQRAHRAGYLTNEEAVNFLMEQFPQFRSR